MCYIYRVVWNTPTHLPMPLNDLIRALIVGLTKYELSSAKLHSTPFTGLMETNASVSATRLSIVCA